MIITNPGWDEEGTVVRGLKDKEKDMAEAPTSADDALLDEFFSLVASIATRLTKDDTPSNNDTDSTCREVSRP